MSRILDSKTEVEKLDAEVVKAKMMNEILDFWLFTVREFGELRHDDLFYVKEARQHVLELSQLESRYDHEEERSRIVALQPVTVRQRGDQWLITTRVRSQTWSIGYELNKYFGLDFNYIEQREDGELAEMGNER